MTQHYTDFRSLTVSTARTCIRYLALLCIAMVLSACEQQTSEPRSQQADSNEKVIIRCAEDCTAVTKSINEIGGSVTITYKNIAALAATIPTSAAGKLESQASVKSVTKDVRIRKPIPNASFSIKRSQLPKKVNLKTSHLITQPGYDPKNYSFNNVMTGATQLHAQDITGRDVIVAVIDTGIANNPEIVPSLAGNIIGGENFVDLPDEPSATSTLNDSHGTWVSSMIAGHLGIILPSDEPLALAVAAHAPESIVPFSDTESMIPMLGSAPESNLYAMKVFSADGSGTPSSIVLAALDRALTLKRNFNAGISTDPVAGDGSEDNPFVYEALNIQVINMSLGGPTLIPGLEVEDLIVVEMLKEGITVVSSVGNEGFGAITGGSPGTSVASLTVGATSSAVHERILRELQLGEGGGSAFRPTGHTQVAYFSSRGPTTDGRVGLQLVANGYAAFVQGADGDFALISGTSFSSPTVAGAAALLRQAKPQSSAAEVRDALMRGASRDIFDGFNIHAIDAGRGFLNVPASLALLMDDEADDDIPPLPMFDEDDDDPKHVIDNIEGLDLNILPTGSGEFSTEIKLKPGEVINFFVPTSQQTGEIKIKIRDFSALPVDEQNAIFGDAILLTVLDAPTSINDWIYDEAVYEDSEFVVNMPQSGLVRVAVMGDWVNVGEVSAKLKIELERRRLPAIFAQGKIRDEETDVFGFEVKKGTQEIKFELGWEADWAHYPPHDIDLILFDPNGEPYFDGATLDIPERVSIIDPVPGKWTALVTGYMLHGLKDRYALSIVNQDGKLVKRTRERK